MRAKMPKPKIIETLDIFRQNVLDKEQASITLMAKRWQGVEKALIPHMDALALQIELMRQEGKEPTEWQLYRMKRYQQLLAQTQQEVTKYENWAGITIENEQKEYFDLGRKFSMQTLGDLVPPGVNISFDRVPADAVQNMIGRCKDDAPLFSVLKNRALYPEAVDGLTTQLINAVALGYNPRKTARLMKDGLAQGLNKALVIARTEQLRAFREASYQNYKKNNNILKGWVWHSALGTRTCAACYAMHGTVHSLDERLDDHVCGRCVMIPLTRGWKELGFDGIPDTNPAIPSGEDMFAKLSEEKQRVIMGNSRYELWKAGKLEFGKMATFTNDPVWGRSVRITPLDKIYREI